MKDQMRSRTLSEMKEPRAKDDHLTRVMEAIEERDLAMVLHIVEKLAAWELDRSGPSISRDEAAQELIELINFRSECVTEDVAEEMRLARTGGGT